MTANAARAVLMILASIRPEDEDEFNLWYDREHLEDRVSVPGFLSARRYRAIGGAIWDYLAIYETTGLEVFRSPAYRAKLAAQTEWSRRVLPRFVNPQRNVTRVAVRVGAGDGVALDLMALRPAAAPEVAIGAFASAARRLHESRPDLVSATLLESDAGLSRPVAEYAAVETSAIGPSDLFILLVWAETDSPPLGDGDLAQLAGDAPVLRVGRFLFRTSLSVAD